MAIAIEDIEKRSSIATLSLPDYAVATETSTDIQMGRLIAKLIAITRYPNTYALDSERQETIDKLERWGENNSVLIKGFIAQLDQHPLDDQRPFVRSMLINNQMRGGVK